MKVIINQIMDYVIAKALDIVLARIQAGTFDAIIQAKVDEIVAQMTVET